MAITKRVMGFLKGNLYVLLLVAGSAGMLFYAAGVQEVMQTYRAYLEYEHKPKERTAQELQEQPIENLVKVLLIQQDRRKVDAQVAKVAGKAMREANARLWIAWLVATVGLAGMLIQRRRQGIQSRRRDWSNDAAQQGVGPDDRSPSAPARRSTP